MADRVRAAAANNARWCDLVCRSHGVPTSFAPGYWVALRGAPELYPDAVTLLPEAPAADVLRLLAGRPGCAVKDSFATLELASLGFEPLFEARWIYREPAAAALTAGGSAWSVVRTAAGLADWSAASGTGDAIGAALLREPSVRVLCAQGPDGIAAGAIANRTGAVVGVSNVFTTTMGADAAWAGIAAALAAGSWSLPLVGYERGEPLEAAVSNGFAEIGTLVVSLRSADTASWSAMIEFRTCPMDEEPAVTLAQGMRDEIAAMYDGLELDGPDMPKAGVAELSPPDGTFIVGYDDGLPVCCGGVKRLPDGTCEIKKMFVVSEARGRGVARALLEELERCARELGYAVARLDTGPKQTRAQRMYERAGYVPIENFNANPVATFFAEKVL